MQFSLRKKTRKKKWIHPTRHTSLWIVLQNEVIRSSILLLELFSLVFVYHVMEKKHLR